MLGRRLRLLLASLWILRLGLRLSLVALSFLVRWRLGRRRLGLVVFGQNNPALQTSCHDVYKPGLDLTVSVWMGGRV